MTINSNHYQWIAINYGNRIEWTPFRSGRDGKISRPCSVSPICLITSVVRQNWTTRSPVTE